MDVFIDFLQNSLGQVLYSERMSRILGAILVVLLALLLKRLFAKIVVLLLKKVTSKTSSRIDDHLVKVLGEPVEFVFVLIGLYSASKILALPPNIDLIVGRILRSLTLFTLFWFAYRAAEVFSVFFKRYTENTESKFDDMLVNFISNALKVVIIALGAITIAQVWFDEIAGILTGLGLGGLAFALAAQDTAKNLFGSITIMLDRPFAIGDWIETPNVEGTIEEIGFRSTRVRTFAQALVTIPNSVMSNDPITNWSRMGKRRISYRLGVNYDATPEQLQKCVERLRQMLENHPEIHPETIFVYFERFGDNALEIFFYFFTKTTNWQKFLEVQQDVNLKVMQILDESGLTVALPSRNVYVQGIDSGASVNSKE
jgi:MscS family membrane protein